MVSFGIAVYKGDLLDRLEAPLFKSLDMYQDNPKGTEADIQKKEAFKEVWNVIQADVWLKHNMTDLALTIPLRWNVAEFSMLMTGDWMWASQSGILPVWWSQWDAAGTRETARICKYSYWDWAKTEYCSYNKDKAINIFTDIEQSLYWDIDWGLGRNNIMIYNSENIEHF